MSDWRPQSAPDVAQRRADMVRRLREYFVAASVMEVDTPALSQSAVSDVQIESLEVTSSFARRPLYLHTSPEFNMKRLLAAGYPDIYSICRVFRDGEAGRRHQPEFTLIEWYRLGYQLSEITTDAVKAIACAMDNPDLKRSADILNYRDAFRQATGLDPGEASIAELADSASADEALRQSLGDDRNDWLDLLLATRVAPSFSNEKLTVLQHYPADQAALARKCPDDSAIADRFEVFMGDVEIANGYVELTDATEQKERIATDQARRNARGLLERPVDTGLLAALEAGLPQCAGVAMGLERLHMLYEKTDDIRNVLTFNFETGND